MLLKRDMGYQGGKKQILLKLNNIKKQVKNKVNKNQFKDLFVGHVEKYFNYLSEIKVTRIFLNLNILFFCQIRILLLRIFIKS